MFKQLLARLTARRAHSAAMALVWRGQQDSRMANRRAWYRQYEVR